MFALDTNALSELLKGSPKFVARFEAVPEETPVVTTTVTRYEILMKGRYQALLTAAERLTTDETRLSAFDILQVTDATADHFEKLLGAKGLKKIGRSDLLIACIWLAHGETLVTRNTNDFKGVPNLKLANWAD